MISLVSLNFHAKSVFSMRKLCCADVIRYFVASVGSSRICFKVFRPSKNWGCPHQVGEGLLVLLEQSHYFNKNPNRANSRKKFKFLNACLFLCCLRRGVIAAAPPFHFFNKTHVIHELGIAFKRPV